MTCSSLLATATTEIYPLSLHDALPIFVASRVDVAARCRQAESVGGDFYNLLNLRADRIGVMIGDVTSHGFGAALIDRKSTRLNSSHSSISYAVFCLKKKKTTTNIKMLV